MVLLLEKSVSDCNNAWLYFPDFPPTYFSVDFLQCSPELLFSYYLVFSPSLNFNCRGKKKFGVKNISDKILKSFKIGIDQIPDLTLDSVLPLKKTTKSHAICATLN